MRGICEWCGAEDELIDIGGVFVCEDCLNDDTASMIISDDIPPSLDEFEC